MQIKIFYAFLVLLLAITATSASAKADPVVGGIVFEGVSAFPQSELIPLYAPVLGQPWSRETETRIEQDIEALYSSRRYLPPEVELEAHPEAEGIFLARVSEPRIGQVDLRTGSAALDAAVQAQVQGIRGQRAVRWGDIDLLVEELERSLGQNLSSSVHRVDERGSDYFLAIQPATEVRGRITYSAEGSERLGRHLAGAQLEVLNPFQGVAELYFSALHTLESAGYRNLGAGLIVPLSSRDALQLDASFARAVPQDDQMGYATVYRRQRATASWTHQLEEGPERETSLTASLTLRDYTREEGDVTEADEQLRMVSVGARTTLRAGNRAHRLWARGLLGLDMLGAGHSGKRTYRDIDVGFQALEAGYTAWQLLPAGFSLRVDTAGQYSPDILPFSQRFAFGGSRFARAYEPGEFSGDTGAGAKFEVRRGFRTDRLGQLRLVPYAYYGLATTYDNRFESTDSGASAGLGLRLLAERFSVFLELGKPLTAASVYQDEDPRLTGRLSAAF